MQFPIKLGARNGGNSRVVRGLQSGVFRQAFTGSWCWIQRVRLADFTPDAATSQTLILNTLFPANPFPEHVERGLPLIWVEENPRGPSITALNVELGDNPSGGDRDGLITSTNIYSAAGTYVQTVGAAEFAHRYEAAYDPRLYLAATGANLSVLTAFDLVVLIKFEPVVEI
jgi:hypothetical protein